MQFKMGASRYLEKKSRFSRFGSFEIFSVEILSIRDFIFRNFDFQDFNPNPFKIHILEESTGYQYIPVGSCPCLGISRSFNINPCLFYHIVLNLFRYYTVVLNMNEHIHRYFRIRLTYIPVNKKN